MNTTQQFLGALENWYYAEASFDDLHSQWGGQSIAVFGDGRVVIDLFAPEYEDAKIEAELPMQQVTRLFEVCVQSDVLATKADPRPKDLDENYERISLINANREPREIFRWKEDAFSPAFDEVRALFWMLRDTAIRN